MADTIFKPGSVINSAWLNDINDAAYKGKDLSGIRSLNVKDPRFGAVGNGIANDAPAIQAALNALVASGGGELFLPVGKYMLQAPLLVEGDNISIIGAAGSGQHAVNTGPVKLIGAHTAGPVLRVKNTGFRATGFMIDGTVSRLAAAATSNNFGIHVESNDSTAGNTRWLTLEDIRISNQPGSGVVLIGDIVSSQLTHVSVDRVGGHGFVVNGGSFTNRVNLQRPGQLNLNNCRASRTGGHALLVGGAGTQTADRPYRVTINNFESFYTCRTASMKVANFDWYLFGENLSVLGSASSGETDSGVPDHGGMYVAGQCIMVHNHRFIDCVGHVALVADHGGGWPTYDVEFRFLYINNENQRPGYYNPAIAVDPTCKNISARSATQSSDVKTLMLTETENSEVHFRNTHSFGGISAAGSFKSHLPLATVGNDQTGFWTTSSPMRGTAIIGGNTDGAGSALIAFRCGDAFAFCRVLSGGGVPIQTAIGALSNGSGADGAVTISVSQTDGKLFISNRTGASRSYFLTLLSADGVVTGFQNL